MDSCDIILTSGCNKGKLCGAVNTKCLHGTYKCDDCGAKYWYKATLRRHRATCAPKMSVRWKPSILPKTTTVSTEMHGILAKMCAQIEALNDRIQQQSLQLQSVLAPHNNVSNVSINIQNNIVVIDPDFYGALVRKMGVRETHACLERAAMGQQMDVLRALYLKDRSPKEWPIARQSERHYRYLDGNRDIVDDPDGRKIGKLLGDSIMNAFLAASSALITEGLTDSAPPELIEQYHHIQAFDHRRLSDLEYVLTGLGSVIPIVDDHPFFV